MCLIAIAGKGTDKYSEEFLNGIINGSLTNTDGIGYAFKKNKSKKVYISKGYDDINKVISSLKSKRLGLNDELVVHLRIGNRGKVSVEMCHPFVVAKDSIEILQNDKYVDKPIMVHNGTFTAYSNYDGFSDTYKFIKEFMHHASLIEMLKTDEKFFKDLFSVKLSTNKLAFLFPNDDTDLIRVGYFQENNGYYYSNDSYKSKKVNIGGEEWDSLEEYYEKRYASPIKSNTILSDDEEENNSNLNKLLNMRASDKEQYGKVSYSKPRIITKEESIDNGDKLNCKIKSTSKSSNYLPFREANENEIPYVKNSKVVFKDELNTPYMEYMGLFIPSVFNEETQFEALQINPNEFNYTDLYLLAINDDNEYGIKKGISYVINSFSPNKEFMILNKVEISTFVGKHTFINIPYVYIHQLFKIKIQPKNNLKYLQYYKLVKEIQPSITSMRHLAAFLNCNKNKKNSELNYKNIGLVSKKALDLFKYMCAYHLNDDHDKAIRHKYMF